MQQAAALIAMPARNEAAHLAGVLAGVRRAAPGAAIVVVDDGSEDDTSAIAARAGATVIRLPLHLGYGGALQTAYKFALARGAELLVQLDADGQHDPADIPALCAPVAAGELDLAIGSRFLGAPGYRPTALKRLGQRSLAGLGRVFGVPVTDPTSGFQAMNRAVLRFYAGDFFPADFPDLDVLVAARRRGLRIGERPVTMHPGLRASSLHAGLAPLYYAYKMSLSTWAAATRSEAPRDAEKAGENT